MKSISVFGLGYVGLPLAELAAKRGYKVIGVDTDESKLKYIKENEYDKHGFKDRIEFTLDGIKAAKLSDLIFVCVPTPVDNSFRPDFSFIRSSCETISNGLRKGCVVVIESTVSPGTCRNLVKPLLEKSGMECGTDFYIVHCPERIDPGNKGWTLEELPRVIGGISNAGVDIAVNFYATILNSKLHILSSIEAAEATKLVENTFRDVNIAFVNELACCFDKLNIDVLEVIKAASTKPFGFMPFYPGCGVGGHCIPVDPYYLIEASKLKGFNTELLNLSRTINHGMVNYTVDKLIEGLNEIGLCVKNAKITVMGIAYKKGVGDIRESPSIEIIQMLKYMNAKLNIYDPFVPELSTVLDIDCAIKADAIVIATDHDIFKNIPINAMKNGGVKVVIDGRNCLNKNEIITNNIIYKGIGR